MKFKIFIFVCLVLSLISLNWYFPFRDYLLQAVEFSQHQGAWGRLIFFLLIVAAGIFLVPIGMLIMIAGTIYGFGWGYLIVASACLCTIVISYGLGKKLWYSRVERLRHLNPSVEAVFESIYQHGVMVVLLIRLNPFLPFGVLNYLFTIPKLDFRKYVIMSIVGLTPDIFFFLYVGRMGKGWLEHQGFNFWNLLVPGLAISMSLISALYINRLVKQAIHPRSNSITGASAAEPKT